MVGFIDGKGIREVKGQEIIEAWELAGSEAIQYAPVFIGISANGDYVCYPTDLSATTNLGEARANRWGIAQEVIASTTQGRVLMAGATKLLDTAASGNYVVGISTNGSIIASAGIASIYTGSATGLGLYSSALFGGDSGMIIW